MTISSSSVQKEASAEPLGTGTLMEQSDFKETLRLTQHPQNHSLTSQLTVTQLLQWVNSSNGLCSMKPKGDLHATASSPLCLYVVQYVVTLCFIVMSFLMYCYFYY